MNEHTQHLTRAFDEELGRLRTLVLEMGGLVEAQILAATQAFQSGEITSVAEIVDTDHKVNEFELLIDDQCTQVIARRQPAAFDLRLVMGVSKIVTDLERVGDEAKKVAKGAGRIHERGQTGLPRGIADTRHVASVTASMLHAALDAFARLDPTSAAQVIRTDQDVDVEFQGIVRQLITFMMEDPRTISTALDVLWIARAIERIGDHAKNIAEHVIYVVEGRDVRHTLKDL